MGSVPRINYPLANVSLIKNKYFSFFLLKISY
jgi:hypothetical protein